MRYLLVSLAFVVLAVNAPRALPDRPQASGASTQAADAPWPPVGVFRVIQGITAPRMIKSARPNYPPEATRAKVQGRVMMEMVVQPDGTVGEVRVVRSLDRKF